MSSVVSQSTAKPEPRPQVLVAAGTTPRSALEAAGIELTGPSGAVVVRDSAGQLRDLDVPFAAGDEVTPVPLGSPDGLAVLRHSTAHVLAQAVQELFPNTLLGIGPPIQDGFYYDFLPGRSPRRTWPHWRRRWPRSSRPASASPGGRSATPTPAPNWRTRSSSWS